MSAKRSVEHDGDPTLPEGFRFGVATAGFQIEGGYNGPGEPRNNWYAFEAEGRVEPSGIANDFWNRYEEQLDQAVAAGCDAFRLSVEWARCEPEPGAYDEDAFARYGQILDACLARGLEPLVSLHHFTHPRWLGDDLWLDGDAPDRFAEWAGVVADRFADRVREWVTVNEPNIYALQTYWTGDFPPARMLDTGAAMRSMDHLLAGHVLAHAEVHARRPDAVVATNTFCFSAYELDQLLVDVLLARSEGVAREQLLPWLEQRRTAYDLAMGSGSIRENVVRHLVGRMVPLDRALPRTIAAVYASPHECTQDVTQVDVYNSVTSSHLRLPGHKTSGGRNLQPGRLLWDDPPDPSTFAHLTRLNQRGDRPVWVVENGLCNRVRNGRSYPRLDGWTRPRYLREHLAQLVGLLDAGVPVGAYFHWTLADNYEWGSYEPRFGLYGVDRERGLRWSDRDAMGEPSAQVYREIIEALRSGDRSVLSSPTP
jgi:beta-glucosidase/6-phospho-beta-glucosidase/beta-galactosidase